MTGHFSSSYNKCKDLLQSVSLRAAASVSLDIPTSDAPCQDDEIGCYTEKSMVKALVQSKMSSAARIGAVKL